MNKLKKLMKKYKIRTFGNYKVTKHIAHEFDKECKEHFLYIYEIEKI